MRSFQRQAVRVAVHRRDGEAVFTALAGVDLDRSFQFAGSALLVPLDQNVAAARVLGEECVAELRERGWEGDEQLAAELNAAMGVAEATALATLAVDIEDLSELLESGDLESGAVNLHTGEVWRSTPLEFRELDEDGPDLDDPDE